MTPDTWTPPHRSPRISEQALASAPHSVRSVRSPTTAELTRMLAMLRQTGADLIAIGHGRHPVSVAAARALHTAWTTAGRAALDLVDWPETAASWLRPARRLTTGTPDAWVLVDSIAGCAQVIRRLADQATWTPTRTLAFAGLAVEDLVRLVAPTSVAGLTGPTATGGTWRIGDDHLIHTTEPQHHR